LSYQFSVFSSQPSTKLILEGKTGDYKNMARLDIFILASNWVCSAKRPVNIVMSTSEAETMRLMNQAISIRL
jgi:hypothetical protein